MRIRLILFAAMASILAACSGDPNAAGTGLCANDPANLERPTWWTVASHCQGAAPDYDLLFPDQSTQAVHRIDITIAPEDHEAMMADLTDLLSGGGPGGPPADTDRDPIWVPVSVSMNDHVWTQVGMRYKGNSSLRSAWNTGIRKLSFRLDFDGYEALYPELDDQRFFGFKKMTFSNGFNDPSLMRDKLSADIFRAAGVPAARGAFARVYVDVGDGPVYFGLYTMIEDPSNKLIETQFAANSGNLYKPDGPGSRWSTPIITADFDKKTNEVLADYSDVEAAVAALHADRQDATGWRQGLEATFDVAGFLRWLAINQVLVNWDTYGWMTHNYYLYGDPSDGGRLVWIPWDLNEAMLDRGDMGPWAGSTSVLLDEIGVDWPMIRYLLDDPVYRETYRAELEAALTGPVALEATIARMQAYHELIAPYVVGDQGESAPYTFLLDAAEFEGSLSGGQNALETHLSTRHQAVRDALGL